MSAAGAAHRQQAAETETAMIDTYGYNAVAVRVKSTIPSNRGLAGGVTRTITS